MAHFSDLLDTEAQLLCGGGGVDSGVAHVDAWHHLGRNHVNPSPNGNDQIDDFNGDPTAQLHNFNTATPGGVVPTKYGNG